MLRRNWKPPLLGFLGFGLGIVIGIAVFVGWLFFDGNGLYLLAVAGLFLASVAFLTINRMWKPLWVGTMLSLLVTPAVLLGLLILTFPHGF